MTREQVLDRLRKQIGEDSLRTAAGRFEVSVAYLSDVMAGKRAPGPKLLKVLGLSVKKTTKFEYQTEKL